MRRNAFRTKCILLFSKQLFPVSSSKERACWRRAFPASQLQDQESPRGPPRENSHLHLLQLRLNVRREIPSSAGERVKRFRSKQVPLCKQRTAKWVAVSGPGGAAGPGRVLKQEAWRGDPAQSPRALPELRLVGHQQSSQDAFRDHLQNRPLGAIVTGTGFCVSKASPCRTPRIPDMTTWQRLHFFWSNLDCPQGARHSRRRPRSASWCLRAMMAGSDRRGWGRPASSSAHRSWPSSRLTQRKSKTHCLMH